MEDNIFVQILILSLFVLHHTDHVLGYTDRVFVRHSQGCHKASHAERLTRSYGEL